MFNIELSPWLSVIPPLVAITLAVLYRQVYAALVIGLWSGSTILAGGHPLRGLADTVNLCVRVFQDPGNTRVILFSALIGAVIAFTQRSGGMQGFINYVSSRQLINTRRRAQFLAVAVGASIPIESSINVLITGTVFRPIFDRLHISREKLAYLCDSISAPVCAMIPINAWGAYMAGLLATQGIDSPMQVYLKALLYNFYPIFALALVFILVLTQRDFFAMRVAEKRAREEGKVLRDGATPLISSEVTELAPKPGIAYKASNLIVPVITLLIMMVAGMLITGGGRFVDGAGSTSVLWAVLAAIAVAGMKYRVSGIMHFDEMVQLFFKGVGGLVPIAVLMMLAFAIGQLCRDMGTGTYVASIAQKAISARLLPMVLFITTGLIAFSTGTSWGTWGIMVPIGIPVVQQMGGDLLPVVAAMVSGGVFGDHCSPISDTTLISSMASAADHMDHVNTQLPYALAAGGVAAVGFLLVGLF